MKIEGVFGGLFGSGSQSGSQPAPRGGTIRAGRVEHFVTLNFLNGVTSTVPGILMPPTVVCSYTTMVSGKSFVTPAPRPLASYLALTTLLLLSS